MSQDPEWKQRLLRIKDDSADTVTMQQDVQAVWSHVTDLELRVDKLQIEAGKVHKLKGMIRHLIQVCHGLSAQQAMTDDWWTEETDKAERLLKEVEK